MSPAIGPSASSRPSVSRQIVTDVSRTIVVFVIGCVAIAVLSVWHQLLLVTRPNDPIETVSDRSDSDPDIVEYELSWYRYIKAFDAHHGPGGGIDRSIGSGSFLRGLRVWMSSRFLRGYTLDDAVFVCPNAPRVLRVHQAGHAPSFGQEFSTLARSCRENDGLPDEPLYTFDVMLPGDFPHTFLRLRDFRGLTETYEQWVRTGRIKRVRW